MNEFIGFNVNHLFFLYLTTLNEAVYSDLQTALFFSLLYILCILLEYISDVFVFLLVGVVGCFLTWFLFFLIGLAPFLFPIRFVMRMFFRAVDSIMCLR